MHANDAPRRCGTSGAGRQLGARPGRAQHPDGGYFRAQRPDQARAERDVAELAALQHPDGRSLRPDADLAWPPPAAQPRKPVVGDVVLGGRLVEVIQAGAWWKRIAAAVQIGAS